MSKLYYRKHGDYYECERIENDEDKRIIILLNEPVDGIILLDADKRCTVTGGVGVFEESVISDGTHRARLVCKTVIYELEAFHVGTGITTLLKSEEYIRGLYLEMQRLEASLMKLTERVGMLEDKIVGKPIF